MAITAVGDNAAEREANERNRGVILRKCALLLSA